uniref:Uncharacterized protein n=1 Tax=Acrobeloides nanus TaxID=290746 RepID=A0A914CXN3_9BILA
MNSSTIAPETSADLVVGYVSLAVSCLAFGTMFAPLKKYDCRDGFFVQWIECAVVFLFGMVINLVRDFPRFNWVAAIGGILYATGNVASVPIVQGIGIGTGMLIWGSIQIIVGWSVGRFGLFGWAEPQPVENEAMNYIGVIITLLSGIMFVFVKNEPSSSASYDIAENTDSNSRIRMNSIRNSYQSTDEIGTVEGFGRLKEDPQLETNHSKLVKWVHDSLSKEKLFYIALSVCLGLLHGMFLTPITIAQNTKLYPDASQNVLDYVFSHFSAVFFFSTIYFFAYAAYKKNRPYTSPELVLPSVAYGVLWSVGMTLFFVSNKKLSQTVSYPITTRVPAIIGALTDIFIFKTIRGKRNLTFLFAAITVGVIGVVLVGLSNRV